MRRSAVVRTGAGAALRFGYRSPAFVLPSLKHPLKRVVSAIKRATRYTIFGGASIAGWDRFSGRAKRGHGTAKTAPRPPLEDGAPEERTRT